MTEVRVARVDLHRAGGPIPRLANARTSWDRRDSIIVALHDGEGRVGLGEIAPLHEPADEPLELSAVRALAPTRPAARFAVELARLDLAAQKAGVSIDGVLEIGSADEVEVSALLGDPHTTDAVTRATRLIEEGARAIKVKLGAGSVDDDVTAVRALRDAIGPEVVLIGDANGAWSIDRARAALDRLAPVGFDYVEQPVAPDDLAALGPCAVAVFADESMTEPETRSAVVAMPHVAGIVCKPTVIGGIAASILLAGRARASGKRVVVTHALEGPVALAGCAALALALGGIASRAGIWPHAALDAFPPALLPGFEGGRLRRTGRPGLGFTPEERGRFLDLPMIEVGS